VTTGLAKAVGGALLGLGAAWVVGWGGVWIVLAGAVVALVANLANLLDLRPCRAIKVWLPAALALVVYGVGGGGSRVLYALGGGVILFGTHELREQLMLGDTGAGLIGGVIGVAAIAALGTVGLQVTLAVLAVLTAASEALSFSRVIEAVRPLRWLDHLGRTE
jgi:hypothetical protein